MRESNRGNSGASIAAKSASETRVKSFCRSAATAVARPTMHNLSRSVATPEVGWPPKTHVQPNQLHGSILTTRGRSPDMSLHLWPRRELSRHLLPKTLRKP